MSSGGHKTSSIARPKAAARTRTHGSPKKRRPASKPAAKAGKATSTKKSVDKRDDSRFADFTRPIPVEKQLVRGWGKRRVIGIGAVVISAAFIAALFVLPLQAWLRQRDDLASKREQLAALQTANAELAHEVQQLQTPEGIEQAAREEIGYVQRGEIRFTVLDAPDAPITMPGGWPYDTIAQIITIRTASSSTP
ncbi:MAG: septum formation initiator family protein [Actinobacteria bacterium]|nr:septum formation initiator family protein [Actinomycetota bacterium]